MRKRTLVLLTLLMIYVVTHCTPELALRTHVFFMGYPVIAVTTDIEDDPYHNDYHRTAFEQMNARAYMLTKPPIEKATESELVSFLVKKKGFLHYAEYLGEM
ncbi:hypothetical protein [Planococcus lenghuensis]|uniref:Uncharacterized protein n=1 Tax=Planococcus lenghuensis TaxID=2213202 RepID=A0A1Q2KWM1_9BACL|nr:hypothetical protein [Planococcus lenghuensis]AQQ52590.1 hypothetical protein B0X71_05425 [Planococcus lenghuensis]